MATFRKRLIFWLFKAYLKKWGKVIALSFISGLVIFYFLLSTSKYIVRFFPSKKKQTIGIVGSYTSSKLPPIITEKLTRGLTKIGSDGSILPDVAEKWEVNEGGKKYIFTIRKNLTFSDGTPLTSELLSYNFSGVKVTHPSKYSIEFELQDTYSPFLVTASRPIFKDRMVGLGQYRVENAKTNGDFIQSIRITDLKNKLDTQNYIFYQTEDTLKTAFLLGEVSEIYGLTNQEFRGKKFSTFPSTSVTVGTDYSRLVTLFFNTQDPSLSDKKFRNGLAYSIPDTFALGERAYLPFSPKSIYFDTKLPDKKQDLAHANLLLTAVKDANSGKIPEVTIKVLEKYKNSAEEISKEWRKAGVRSKVLIVDSVPDTFQIYLGEFSLPKDPDQYSLWHSKQQTNITKYDSKRIDKLLEDARKSLTIEERQQLYSDFQKYLQDDSPAAFLYFPYSYAISR
jgi:peptide/nickel transport system substrate-binding protein